MLEDREERTRLTRREAIARGAGGVALLSSGGLAACGSSTNSATTAARQKPGGTLRVGFPSGGPGSSIDPDVGAQVTPDYARFFNLYDRLLVRDENYQLKPYLAEEVTPNATADVWTVRLKDGVEFHNGKSMTADDVIFSIRRHANPKSIQAPLLSAVDLARLQKVDRLTVRIPLTHPYSVLDNYLANNAGIVLPVGFDPTHPIGSGPFRYVSFRPGTDTVLTRFDNWAFGRAFVDELHLIDFADDTARANALLSRQVDAISDLPASQIQVARASSSVEPWINQSGEIRPIVMNLSAPPFTDVRVTQAIRLIADRPQLIASALSGQGTVGNDVFGRFDPVYIGDQLPQRHQDLEQAKFLLKQAGHSSLSLQLITSNFAGGIVEASTVLAQQAKGAGVNIAINVVPPANFFGPKYLSYIFSVSFWTTPEYLFVATLAQAPHAIYPETHFRDPQWAKLWAQATAEVDPAKRKEIAGEMQRIDYDRGGYLIWSFPNYVDAVSTKTTGWRKGKFGNPLGDLALSKVSFG